MSLFGAFVRTVVNVATLPVTLPLAVAKDAVEVMADGDVSGRNLRGLVQAIKREAEEALDGR